MNSSSGTKFSRVLDLIRSWTPEPDLLDRFSLTDLRLSFERFKVEESDVAINVSRSPRSISFVVKFLKVSSVKGSVPSSMDDLWRRVFFSFRSMEGNSIRLARWSSKTSFVGSAERVPSSRMCLWWCSFDDLVLLLCCFFFLLSVPFSVMSMSFDAKSIRSWTSSAVSGRRWCWNKRH